MVIDTSALVAIFSNEPERRVFIDAIEAADARRISAASWVEVSIVMEVRHGAEGLRDLDLFLERANVEVVGIDRDQARAARYAFSRYGKGRHRAALNFGDCFAYALAKTFAEPLLCKGADFMHTDLIVWRSEPPDDETDA